MTPSDVRSEISRLISCLLELEMAINVRGAVVRRLGPDTLVTYASSQTDASLSDQVYASVQEYRHALRTGQYTALLLDGALLQISYRFNRDKIVAQRFCYYPCPLVLDADDVTEDLIELIDMRLAEEFYAQTNVLSEDNVSTGFRLRLRGPLRFEYDGPNAGPSHPASHLHLIGDDVRWPIFGPLSIGHFVRFVFTYFYSGVLLQPLREWPVTQRPRTVSDAEEETLFIECRHRV